MNLSAAARLAPSACKESHVTLASALTAARRRASTLLDRFSAWVKDITGPVEFTIGWWCDNCEDVHDDGIECPRIMIGQCADCGVVVLTPAGNCPESGQHVVYNRSLKASDV